MAQSFVPRLHEPFHPLRAQKISRQNLTFRQRLEVIEFHHANQHLTLDQMVQPLRERGFMTICASTIKRCVDREQEDRAYVQSGDPSRLDAKRQTLVTHPEVETALLEWIKSRQERGVLLGSLMVCEKARMICEELGIPEERRLKFSKSWLDGFKKRHGVVLPRVTYYGELLPDLPPRRKKPAPSGLQRAPPRRLVGLKATTPPPYFYNPYHPRHASA